MTTEEDGNTLDGAAPELFIQQLEQQGANVVGLNCSVGPAAMLETIERIARVAKVPLSAQPNAGRPREVEGRHIYLCSPEYMASYARRFINSGVRLVGGCCGTTPDHIRQIRVGGSGSCGSQGGPRPSIRSRRTRRRRRRCLWSQEPNESRMAHALARGTFVVSLELLPPRGHRTDELLESARQLRIRGIDLVEHP